MSAPTSDPIGCGPMPDAAQEAGGAVAELLAKLPDAETLAELAREAQHNGLRIETNVYLIAAELQRAAARPCPALDECKDALENIALLDEADGHQLNRGHAYEAVAIATKVLGKHPSEILQSRCAAAQRTAQREPVAWQSGDTVPTINDGTEREFILAVRRARTGKVYTFACMYLNRYRLQYQDDCGACDKSCEDGDGCATTGWFELSGDDDYEYMYRALSLYEGDKIEGWRELPRWEAAPPPPPAAGAQAEAMRMALEALKEVRHLLQHRAAVAHVYESLPEIYATIDAALAQIEAPGAGGKP